MLRELWRITSFRLTLLYGGLFAVAVVVLVAFVYHQTAAYQIRQVDQLLRNEMHAFGAGPRDALPGEIEHEMRRDVRHINFYGLFAADGTRIAGNLAAAPRELTLGDKPQSVAADDINDLLAPDQEVRAVGAQLAGGEVLVVARDVALLKQLRVALLRGCVLVATLILGAGVLGGVWYSWPAVRHIRAINEATRRIAAGDYRQRLPLVGRNHELDVLARIVNAMLDDTERLLGEVKSCSDNIAHDLRTPLTRLRAAIYRAQQSADEGASVHALLDSALTETDLLLNRFRALARISEIESHRRLAGFALVDPEPILRKLADLYEPLASQRGITLSFVMKQTQPIACDGELLFEAIGNLLDNALKFTPPGGRVTLSLATREQGAEIVVSDNGPGIPEERRKAVLQRFYRTDEARNVEGSGLGLSLVDAIVRLHGFTLTLDASPDGGTRAELHCWRSSA